MTIKPSTYNCLSLLLIAAVGTVWTDAWTRSTLPFTGRLRRSQNYGCSSSQLLVSLSGPPPSGPFGNPWDDSVKRRLSSIAPPPVIDFDWKAVAESAFANSSQPIILFDGECNFCNGGVNLCLDWDPRGFFRFASLQSKTGQALLLKHGRRADDLSTLVLVTPTNAYFHSEAVLRVGEQLNELPSLVRAASRAARLLLPKQLTDVVYKIVARNRYVFGHTDGPTCRLDYDGSIEGRFLEDPPSPSCDLASNMNQAVQA